MSTMKQTLKDRGKKYGDFAEMSSCICDLQRVIVKYQAREMEDFQYHALGMIMVKLGRIITGDPDYDDNWKDIIGYATKVLENLPKE